MKKNNTTKPYILRILYTICIFILGLGIGILVVNKYNEASMALKDKVAIDKLITDKIAIVNLDNGVLVNNEKVNYASKLLVELEDNFLFTGLEDARSGYDMGIYAGYLVIPATFSECVVSLNDMPIRAEITYVINENLKEDVKEDVIYDVLGLVSELNNSVSYMYMHSVLDEVHDAQDEAGTVMQNDLEEKEAINAITPNDLVALIPITEITEVENNIVPVDVTEYISKNMEFTSQIGSKYNEYLMASETDHQKINEEAMDLMKEMGKMESIIGNIDLAYDEEGKLIYQKGIDEFKNLFDAHNGALIQKEGELQENVLKIYKDIQIFLQEYQRSKDAYVKECEEKYTNTIVAVEEQFEPYSGNCVIMTEEEYTRFMGEMEFQRMEIEMMMSILSSLWEQGIIEPPEGDFSVTIPQFPEVYPITFTDMEENIKKIIEDNYYVYQGYLLDEEGNIKKNEEDKPIFVTSLLDEYQKDLTKDEVKKEIFDKQVGEIEKLDISTATQIVEEGILSPIQEKINQIKETIFNQYAVEKEQLTEFNNAVMEYNPLKYINQEEIDTLTSAMFTNGTELSKAIVETDIQQMEYVANVYEATRNDLANMQESIVDAKELSDRAVADGLAQLQEVKNANSEENQRIMYDFSAKLPYTRLGSLEYRQAYEFMANPIAYIRMENVKGVGNEQVKDTVRAESDSVDVIQRNEKDNKMIIAIIAIIIYIHR